MNQTISKAPRLTAAELTRRIEHDISIGVLPMGSWLKQVDLEAAYGCNRIDVRGALDRLVEKGLVVQIAQRGYRVQQLDPRRMVEIRDVRAILEVAAVEDVMKRIDEAGLAGLKDAAQRFDAAVRGGTVIEQEAGNALFHERMLAYCPNRELVATIFELRRRVPLVFTRERNTGTIMRRSAKQHFEMIDKLRARDLQGLRDVMRSHVVAEHNTPAAAGEGE
jgi:DNA-binding GntR family transcriptional regulator